MVIGGLRPCALPSAKILKHLNPWAVRVILRRDCLMPTDVLLPRDLPRSTRREWELAHNVVDHISVLTANYGVFFCALMFFPPLEYGHFRQAKLVRYSCEAGKQNKKTFSSQPSLGKGMAACQSTMAYPQTRACIGSKKVIVLPPTCLMCFQPTRNNGLSLPLQFFFLLITT